MSMKILRTSDRVKLKFGDISLTVQPMDYARRVEMTKFVTKEGEKEKHDFVGSSIFTVKHTVKAVEGIQDAEGNPLKLTFDPDGSLSQEDATDILVILNEAKPIRLAMHHIAGAGGSAMPQILDPETGTPLEGLEVNIIPKAKWSAETQST